MAIVENTINRMKGHRMSLDDDTVEFTGRIPLSLMNRYKRVCPTHGANTWFINMALETFVSLMEQLPDMTSMVERSVRNGLSEKLSQ